MASEYWLCVQIPVPPCPVQWEKDKWRCREFFPGSSFGLPIAVAALLTLTGCSTPTVVTLHNGTQYLTEDLPKTKTGDGLFEFEDIAGAKVKVRADDVATILEED